MQQNQVSENTRKEVLLELLSKQGVSLDLFPYEWLCTTDFFVAPASTIYHAAYEGGLFDHSFNVTMALLAMSSVTKPWGRRESPVIIGMLHDVTKIGTYEPCQVDTEGNNTYTHRSDYTTFGGHGYDSVCKIEQHMALTDEEKACIRFHMGAYETDAWDQYDAAIRKYPNVLWTHTADMLASKVMEGQYE